MIRDPRERFSSRVENYVRFRPGYPAEAIAVLERACGLRPGAEVADVGSGTGILTRLLLDAGCRVYGVEPNEAMRQAAEEYLKDFANFISHDGTAENTNLADSSIDFVVAAQAFHWFDADKTRDEFRRILKAGGYVALIWNERQLDTTEFLREYEKLLLKYAADYEKVRHENIDQQKLGAFFQDEYGRASYPNVQVFDLAGLRGRLLSSSYMPAEDDPSFPALEKELQNVFAKHAENDRIKVFYDTNIYYKQY